MNFLVSRQPRRWLPAAIATVCGLCAVMLWMVIWGPASGSRTASIGDFRTASASHDVLPEQEKIPRALSDAAAGSLALGLEPDTLRYYEPLTGRAFLADLRQGQNHVISERKLSGFIQSWWIPGAMRVISSFDRQGIVEHRYFDYATQKVQVIGNAVAALTISPDSRQIAYADTVEDTLGLYTAEPDGTGPQRILVTRAADIELSWPQKDLIALVSRRPDRTGRDMTWVRPDGTLETFISDKENLEYAWSRDGSKLLFSYFLAGEGISLWYRDLAQGIDRRLDMPTSAKKCAWHPSGTAVTCGVPSKNGLTGDIPADQVATNDDIVTMDFESGRKETNYSAQTGTLLGVIGPVISSSGRYIAFPNIFDRRLYYFEL